LLEEKATLVVVDRPHRGRQGLVDTVRAMACEVEATVAPVQLRGCGGVDLGRPGEGDDVPSITGEVDTAVDVGGIHETDIDLDPQIGQIAGHPLHHRLPPDVTGSGHPGEAERMVVADERPVPLPDATVVQERTDRG